MIDIATLDAILFWGIAVVLGILAFRRGREVGLGAMREAARNAFRIGPRIILAILAAGFIAQILPREPVARLIGGDSGVVGILIASLAGGFVPSGPIISFPLVVILRDSGAGLPQLVAFLTAWSVFAFHRVLTYELPLMGWRFSATRLTSSLILPPLTGLIAMILQALIRS